MFSSFFLLIKKKGVRNFFVCLHSGGLGRLHHTPGGRLKPPEAKQRKKISKKIKKTHCQRQAAARAKRRRGVPSSYLRFIYKKKICSSRFLMLQQPKTPSPIILLLLLQSLIPHIIPKHNTISPIQTQPLYTYTYTNTYTSKPSSSLFTKSLYHYTYFQFNGTQES